MLAASCIAVTLWLGGWVRAVQNSSARAAWLAAAVRECAERADVGPGVLADPGAFVPGDGGGDPSGYDPHAEDRADEGAGDWAGRVWRAAGAGRPGHAAARRA